MTTLYNRASYWLFVLEIPHVRGKELLSAVKIKLTSLYPGNIADCVIQIRKNGSKKGSHLVFVLNNNTGAEMLPLSPLLAQYMYANKKANILYVDKQWLEYISVENGAIVSSTVKARNEATQLDDVRALCGTENAYEVYCYENDKVFLAALQDNANIDFIDFRLALKKVDVHKISLFSEKSPSKKRQRFFFAAFAALLFVLFSIQFYQHHQRENERAARMRLEQEQLLKEAADRQRENQRLLALRSRHQEITAAKTASPFDISAIIAQSAEPRTRIQSATFNGNFFQIEGLTNNPLALLRNFENHSLISDVRLHQVHPSNNMDTFTLSGSVRPQTSFIDESLPINKQIILLENLVALETNSTLTHVRLSPSAFGEAVHSLFRRWGAAVSSYQFLNVPHYTEVEFSLRSSGNGFFSALYELQTRYPLWDVRLTQIRNLYPRNMLEILIRIRTPYSDIENNSNDLTQNTFLNQPPIVSITRNYFIPSPAPLPLPPEPKVIKEPIPIALPPPPVQQASWIVYIGTVREDDDIKYMHFRNTRNGALLRLSNRSEGNMRYSISGIGNIRAYINDTIYEISRR